ncbi:MULTISPECIES: hypothetical protein [Achromobacter]|uniref:Uncharacterized protein n=1 Tax=Achromobacter spanius TaxID=217203 RepID=A0ABY8GWB3_9BURK|nr:MULTISPECIES: hypothetical protein [Achromobacter]WAI81621.1 hypothetical protein N8Z00_19020 [Achromobacter spanius]WEX97139.1 hypothetical protein N3Z32_13630 [Achromobacter sp. SS2-2022]WFP09145.1 hypothetical protein P8T11_04485 [Achromobacter spanius]
MSPLFGLLFGLLLGLAIAPAYAAVLYDSHGLVVDVATSSHGDWNTGQRQHTRTTTINFQGNKLCGRDVGRLLYPDGKHPDANAFFCAGNAKVLETDAVLAYFTSGSANTVLAHLQVIDGALRVKPLALSDQRERNRPAATRFEAARLPGWTRVETTWGETVMIRHAPLKAQNLGAGKLLDVDGDVAYLAIPPGRDVVVVQPATRVKDAQGDLRIVPEVVKFVDTPLAFRAVRLRDGRELARLDLKDTCLTLPTIEYNRPDPGYPSSAKPAVLFDDVPGWRAATLQFAQSAGRASLQLKPGAALPAKAHCKRG